jgi:hypothetical protein
LYSKYPPVVAENPTATSGGSKASIRPENFVLILAVASERLAKYRVASSVLVVLSKVIVAVMVPLRL